MRCRLKHYKHFYSYTCPELLFPSIILLYLLAHAIYKLLKRSLSENEQSFILFGVDNYVFWMKNSCFSKPMLTMTQMLLLNCKSCASICSQFSLWMCKKMETLLWNGIRFNWGLSYPLLVILFLCDCRDKELRTPFHKFSFFLLFNGLCTISALS